MADEVYVYIWPIVDLDLPQSALEAEAGRELSYALCRLGLVATGRPRFRVTEDWRLFAAVPVRHIAAEPEPDTDVDEAAVRARIRAGETDGHIAARLGLPRSVVERIRAQIEHKPAEVLEVVAS